MLLTALIDWGSCSSWLGLSGQSYVCHLECMKRASDSALYLWLITQAVMAICRLIWNVSAWSTTVIYVEYLSRLRVLKAVKREKSRKFLCEYSRCNAAAALCFSITWLLMNLSSESYAIAQWAWQRAPDSFVILLLIVQRLDCNMQQ